MTWEQKKGEMQAKGMELWAKAVGCETPIEFFAYLKVHENDRPLYMTIDEVNANQTRQ